MSSGKGQLHFEGNWVCMKTYSKPWHSKNSLKNNLSGNIWRIKAVQTHCAEVQKCSWKTRRNERQWGDAKAHFNVLYQTETTKQSESFVHGESPNPNRPRQSTAKQVVLANPLSVCGCECTWIHLNVYRCVRIYGYECVALYSVVYTVYTRCT